MNCQKCQQRAANVHITQFINGEKHETHLCEQCAQSAKIGMDFPQMPMKNLKNLLGFLTQVQGTDKKRPEVFCPNCQAPYSRIYETGCVSCSHCYEYFSSEMESVLKKIHGANRHCGKIPARLGASFSLKREIEDLKVELRRAVEREEYEKAAGLRDRIKSLEEKLTGGSRWNP